MSKRAPFHAKSNGKTADTSATDLELLGLCDELEQIVASARNLILSPSKVAWIPIAAAKDRTERRLRAMLRANRQLQDESDEPYRYARMFLTDGVLFYAKVVRNLGIEKAKVAAQTRARAEKLAHRVGRHFPALRARMSEEPRLDAIGKAIASCGTRPNWKAIAACWDGIEPEREHMRGERDPERWRIDHSEYKKEIRTG